MKILVSFLFIVLLSSCGSNNLPFGADVKDLSQKDITQMYDSETKSLDLSWVGLQREVNLDLLLSDNISEEIERINLANNNIDSLILWSFPKLVYLNLAGNGLDDKDLKNLAKIKTSQTYLDLSGNKLSTKNLNTIQKAMEQKHPGVK